ncbi:MAG: hypothetical protein FJX76_03860 [Armatimonadetes bacterium]|nr:hypothetical protein [Armatimonadota bacterium]
MFARTPLFALGFLLWLSTALQAATVSVPLEEVPIDAHRLAARCLEERRFEENVTPGWREAVLGREVYVFHRPDVQGAAYFEFPVQVGDRPAGFILVSAGRHDFPILKLHG